MIDQYIAPGEQKWGLKSRLALLLPHGYEGQGPEHSSARIERYLALCAEENMIVTYPTTPAQYFHLLRRQAKLEKPLIVFTPKGLLRLPACQSTLEELATGEFKEILDSSKDPAQVERLIFCSGRIYYDLIEQNTSETAIIRIEQFYPFHSKLLQQIINRYKNAKSFIWVQEEPCNMGPRGFIFERLQPLLPENSQLEYRGRRASSAPACGSHSVHEKEQEEILHSLFRGKT
jgi:2-oxoglutarate dehydrogenase E1 component